MNYYPLTSVFLSIILLIMLIGCQSESQSVSANPHAAVGVLDAAISKDGRFSLVSSVNFGAAYWDLDNNLLKYQWKHSDDPNDAILAVDIADDGSHAITANKRTFIIWDTKTGKSLGYWQAPADITAVAISDNAKFVLLGLSDGRAIHINMQSGRRLEFTGHRAESVASVDLSANGLWALSGGNDFRAILWSSETGQPYQLFQHNTRVTKVRLGPSGKRIFTSGTLGNARIWDIQSGNIVSKLDLRAREYVISAASFSNRGNYLVTGAPGRDVSLWAVDSGKRIKQWQVRTRDQGKPSGAIVYAAAFTRDDKYILTESSAGFGEKWAISGVQN